MGPTTKATPMTTPKTTTVRTEYSRDVLNMGSNVAPRVLGFKSRRAPSPSVRPVPHDVRLSESWGCQVHTAHNRRMLIGQWIEDVVQVYRDAGDNESLGNLLARIDAASAGKIPVSLPDALYRADRCDAAEDTAQAQFIYDRSDGALDAYINHLSQELYSGTQLLALLRDERKRRKDAK